jgi:hypothetical protein
MLKLSTQRNHDAANRKGSPQVDFARLRGCVGPGLLCLAMAGLGFIGGAQRANAAFLKCYSFCCYNGTNMGYDGTCQTYLCSDCQLPATCSQDTPWSNTCQPTGPGCSSIGQWGPCPGVCVMSQLDCNICYLKCQ